MTIEALLYMPIIMLLVGKFVIYFDKLNDIGEVTREEKIILNYLRMMAEVLNHYSYDNLSFDTYLNTMKLKEGEDRLLEYRPSNNLVIGGNSDFDLNTPQNFMVRILKYYSKKKFVVGRGSNFCDTTDSTRNNPAILLMSPWDIFLESVIHLNRNPLVFLEVDRDNIWYGSLTIITKLSDNQIKLIETLIYECRKEVTECYSMNHRSKGYRPL